VNFMTNLLIKGGPLMWPLLFCSILALAIMLERLMFWWRRAWNRNDDAVEMMLSGVESGQSGKALEDGRKSRDTTVQVLCYGLLHRRHGLTEAMQVRASEEVASMRRGLLVLDTITTMAPLLGILGTVTGIIKSFELLGSGDVPDPRAISVGISEALITTAAGLVVALPTLAMLNYLVGKVQTEARRIEIAATQFEVACRKGLHRGDG